MNDQKKKILLIEDEDAMLKILAETFTENAFTVLEAKDGNTGLTTALSAHPDIIVMDILMPQMDGLTFLQTLRHDPWGKTVPVVILSNVSPDSNKILQTVLSLAPAYYFLKSDIALDHLVEKVQGIFAGEVHQAHYLQ